MKILSYKYHTYDITESGLFSLATLSEGVQQGREETLYIRSISYNITWYYYLTYMDINTYTQIENYIHFTSKLSEDY